MKKADLIKIKEILTERLLGGQVSICWLKDLEHTAETERRRCLFAVDDRGLVSGHVTGRDDGILQPATAENSRSIRHSNQAEDKTRIEFKDSSNFDICASDDYKRPAMRVANGALLVFSAGTYRPVLRKTEGLPYVM